MARYFDGEWNSITARRQHPERTGGGHLYFPKLRDDLCQSILKPHQEECYIYGTWYAIESPGHFSHVFCKHNQIKIKWYDGYIFHDALMKGTLFPLIDALRKKSIIFVAPPSLREIDKSVFPIDHYVEIIERDCYLQKEDMIARTLRLKCRGKVISVHASLAGKVIVYELFKHLKDSCWIIDFGSIWNIFCEGTRLRGWWRQLLDKDPKRFHELVNLNLGINI